jgi:hypothetical protein
MSYDVSQRGKEIGIRTALGADRHAVLDLVLRGGLKMTAGGVAACPALGAGIARVAGRLRFGVSAYDPATYAGLAALRLVAAVAAAHLSARRATALDPLSSLRQLLSYRLARGSYGSACASGWPGAGSPRRPGCGSLAPSGIRGPRLTLPLRISFTRNGTSNAIAKTMATRIPTVMRTSAAHHASDMPDCRNAEWREWMGFGS